MNSFFLALTAACFWGLSAFLEKLGLRDAPPFAGVVARSAGVLLGTLVFILLSPKTGQEAMGLSARAWSYLMSAGVLASVVAQIFFYQALKGGEIGRVASVGGAWPAVAFLLSLIILREPATGQKLAGIALVVLGVALLK